MTKQKGICPSCEQTDFSLIKVVYDGNQKLLKCKRCHLIFRLRLADFDQEICYTHQNLNETFKNDLIESYAYRSVYKSYVAKLIKKHNKVPENILDIGCSTGSFLNIISKQLPDTKTIGIEPSLEEIKLGQQMNPNANIQFINQYYDQDSFSAESLDVIHHSHVLEHITNPKSFLQNNHLHLKKGGLLLLTYPSANSLMFYIDFYTKRYPGHIIQEQHFNYFSSKSIIQLLQNSGFTKIEEYYGLSYLKKEKSILKYTIDPIFKFLKFGSPYILCVKE